MKRNARIFIAVAVAQLVLLSWGVITRERVLRQGEVFLFRTAPVDPRDPFRGEYVRLDFAAERGRWVFPDSLDRSTTRLHAVLAKDTAGHAQITHLRTTPPADGAYITVRPNQWQGKVVYGVDLPLDRYYLKEGEGPRTEDLLAGRFDDDRPEEPLPAVAVVRVLNGRAVLEDLVVGGRPLRQWWEAP